MLLMSRHLTEYYIVPAGAVIRINLAWEKSLDQLREHLDELTHHVFLDIPCGRKKPPNHNHKPQNIVNILHEYDNIKYVGISQVDYSEDLMEWYRLVPPRIVIVPKIESCHGCNNIRDIIGVLRKPKTIMLDHDDLFQDIVNIHGCGQMMYKNWINPLLDKCKEQNVRVLRTAGVVFTDK